MKTTKITLLITLLFTFCFSNAQNWELVWADEFTTEIGSEWGYDIGGDGWGNNELQYYRAENATIENGNLVITAKKEDFGGNAYTSSRLKTQGNISWKYGKIEARIKLPAVQGTWPAFWMIGDNISSVGWPACGEIDILEQWNTLDEAHGTIHWDSDIGYYYYSGHTYADVQAYNIYSIEWDETAIHWFLNGVQFHEANITDGVNGTSEFHENFFLILNMAVGGNLPGWDIDDSNMPAKMYVDYVRVYENTAPAEPTTTAPIGSKIYLKGSNRKYVNSQNGYSGMTCDSRKADDWEYFTVIDAGDAKIALQGSNGLFVSSEDGITSMMCNRSSISDWEKFTWVELGDGEIALQGSNSLFASSENGLSAMYCNRSSVGDWESFTWGTSRKSATVDILENSFAELNIFPNPAINKLNIQTSEIDFSAELYDTQGKQILKETTLSNNVSLNISEIKGGIYVLKLKSTSSTITKQIVIK